MKRERQGEYDKAYYERIVDGLLELVMRESVVEQADGTKAAVIKSGEVWDALTDVGGMLIAGSDNLSSPTKIREFLAGENKRIAKVIIAARDKSAGRADVFTDLPNHYDD